MKNSLIKFSIEDPQKVFLITGLITLLSLLAIFRISVDTDPENMLPHGPPARVLLVYKLTALFTVYRDKNIG